MVLGTRKQTEQKTWAEHQLCKKSKHTGLLNASKKVKTEGKAVFLQIARFQRACKKSKDLNAIVLSPAYQNFGGRFLIKQKFVVVKTKNGGTPAELFILIIFLLAKNFFMFAKAPTKKILLPLKKSLCVRSSQYILGANFKSPQNVLTFAYAKSVQKLCKSPHCCG